MTAPAMRALTIGRRAISRVGLEGGRALGLARRLELARRGRLVPYLRPPWDERELTVAAMARWDSAGSVAAAREAESAFLRALGMSGTAVATSSGRTALWLLLRALRRLEPGRSEVVIPSYQCRGLFDPVVAAGLTPVYADLGSDLNLSAETVRPLLSARTLAVVVVHLGGRRATDGPAIREAAERAGAVVVDDLCQALGGGLPGPTWGAESPFEIYSFGLGKTLSATAGGMLVARQHVDAVLAEAELLTDEAETAARERFDYISRAYFRRGVELALDRSPPEPIDAFASSYGFFRMSALDARLLVAQLDKLPTILEAHRRNAARLVECLKDVRGVEIVGSDRPNTWCKVSVRAASVEAARRIGQRLRAAGVEPEVMYTPLHLREFGRAHVRGPLAATESAYRRVFNVPHRPSLSPEELEHVCRSLGAAAREERGAPL